MRLPLRTRPSFVVMVLGSVRMSPFSSKLVTYFRTVFSLNRTARPMVR